MKKIKGDPVKKPKIDPLVSSAAAIIGRLGGIKRSKLKAKASRTNGNLGGRPRKDKKDAA